MSTATSYNRSSTNDEATEHARAVQFYKSKLHEHQTESSRLKELNELLKAENKKFVGLKRSMKAILTGGQMVGEVLRKLSDDKYVIKTTNGPRYVVGVKTTLDQSKIESGTRITMDTMTYSIMRILPREVDPTIYAMSRENPGDITFEKVGGLSEQVRQLREVIELPLLNPGLFERVGIKAPKGCLLYGPPGTGKTLLARAIAHQLDCHFLKVVASSVVDKYIGESARMIRDMFQYARDHQPCIIFMDEIDAIGGKRFSEGSSADREIQRTLMELLNQLDGFDQLEKVKVIMATNRPDTLDPALLRPGRIDRKIHVKLPNEAGRLEILRIYIRDMNLGQELDLEPMIKMTDGFNGADLRNVCTEAGLFALRSDRDYVLQEDFMKALRKMEKNKRLENKLDYKPV